MPEAPESKTRLERSVSGQQLAVPRPSVPVTGYLPVLYKLVAKRGTIPRTLITRGMHEHFDRGNERAAERIRVA